jgi:hypothetical protein
MPARDGETCETGQTTPGAGTGVGVAAQQQRERPACLANGYVLSIYRHELIDSVVTHQIDA